MALADVTYRFVTGTLISEAEHNTNNQDLIDALTDGVTDINLRSLISNNLDINGNSSIGDGSSNIEINGTVSSNLIPASTSLTIGSTAKPFASLFLNNGSTDGGAIYFGSKFIKSTADGTELDFSGWTTHDFNSKQVVGINKLDNATATVTGDMTAGDGVRGDLAFWCAYGNTLSTSSPINFTSSTSTFDYDVNGFIAKRSGVIYYASVRFVVTSYSSTFTLSFYLYKNGSIISGIGTGQSITGNGVYTYEIPVQDRDDGATFSANDVLAVYTLGTSGATGSGYVMMGVYYDS